MANLAASLSWCFANETARATSANFAEPSLNIVVVGWGSLIWRPGSLRLRTRWRQAGPRLPIEFARISRDGRLTLVIHPGAEDQSTYWALSELTVLDEARDDLCAREGSGLADIHHVLRDGRAAEAAPPDIVRLIGEWLARLEDVDAVVWTGLPSNWEEKRQRQFTREDAVEYVKQLEAGRDNDAYSRAREYVTHAPPQIDTVVRRALRRRGWEDAQLPATLFED